MANQLDSFSAQIVNYVRTGMSDAAVLELVKNKLGLAEGEIAGVAASGRSSRKARAAAPAAAAPSAAGAARGGRKKAARKASGKKKAKARAKAKAAPRAARAAMPGPSAAPARPAKAKAKAKPARGKKAGRRGGGNRDQEMEAVERAIKASKGMSASEISSKTKIPQSRVSAHVRALKGDKRIFQGGDRRFARYAGDQKTAEQASEEARKNAAGPRRS